MGRLDSTAGKYKLVHEWFAGWRWELWRENSLVDESLESFETAEDCARDARQRDLQRAQPGRRAVREAAAA